MPIKLENYKKLLQYSSGKFTTVTLVKDMTDKKLYILKEIKI